MDLNYKDFININKHEDRINREVQRIREKFAASVSNPEAYLYALSEYFIEDIKFTTNQIYKRASLKKDIDPEQLKSCIRKGGESFFKQYEEAMNQWPGMMFNSYSKIDNFLISFKEEAYQILDDQCEYFDSEYRKWLEEKTNNNRMLIFTIIAAIGAFIAAIPIITGCCKAVICFILTKNFGH